MPPESSSDAKGLKHGEGEEEGEDGSEVGEASCSSSPTGVVLASSSISGKTGANPEPVRSRP
jgi:hypothetical protein